MRSLAGTVSDLGLPDNHILVKSPDRALHMPDLPGLIGAGSVFAGRQVVLCLTDPFDLIQAIIALDGQAAAMMLLAPDLPPDRVQALMAQAGFDDIISDRRDIAGAVLWSGMKMLPDDGANDMGSFIGGADTRWLLTTSGTTGMPRLVWHERASLIRTVRMSQSGRDARWAMLYDPSRFAGTQVLMQALLSGASLLTPATGMDSSAVIGWLADEGCTHISATPSLWRRILMAPAAARLPLRQITLGGEIADDIILGALRSRFPDARITHIYASTETGVGFSVQDGKAGFPAAWLEEGAGDVRIAVRDGLLWLRPPGDAPPRADHAEQDAQGFICTRDAVEQRGERIYFLGREDASLNVGGIKVQIEAVEEVVHRHPAVAQCRITARPSPIMGNLLTLSVVPHVDSGEADDLRRAINQYCKTHLPRAAQPATIRIVAEIPVTAAGKMERAG